MAQIEIKNFSFLYKSSGKQAVHNVSFDIHEGEFLVLIGQSGCGKTTILRHLKPEIAPFGEKSGTILYNGIELSETDKRITASEIGFVMQNPETQIVTDKVWHELAFGLENLGTPPMVIRRRVAEMASFFGIGDWFRRDISELSGGQKQLLNLAAVMVMQPKVLILDEPTSQLDPIASTEFLETLTKINRELGTTIILSEHRLEEIYSLADRIAVIDNSSLFCIDTPAKVGKLLALHSKTAMFLSLPTPIKVYSKIGLLDCPLTVRDGRRWLHSIIKDIKYNKIEQHKEPQNQKLSLELQDVYFKYGKHHDDVLRGVHLKAYEGELLCVVGGNGSGKTTMLNVISGISKAYRGKINVLGKPISDYKGNALYINNLTMLPQSPQAMFMGNTLIEDLLEVTKETGITAESAQTQMEAVVAQLGIEDLLQMHPYDLSGGEMQKAALAKILMLNPKIILLDEPTKGLDNHSKAILADIFSGLKAKGVCLLMITHDVEFSAEYADRVAMFFDGNIISEDNPVAFYSGNSFYTTAANRMSREIFKNAVTSKDVIKLCKLNLKTP